PLVPPTHHQPTMALLRRLLLLAAAAAGASARVVDSLPGVPRDWVEVRAARADEPITLSIGLRQQRAAELEQAVLEISTPGHALYGRHLSRDELRAYTAPSSAALAAVHAWLDDHGIAHYAIDNDWVTLTS